jgi:hypothetical protein
MICPDTISIAKAAFSILTRTVWLASLLLAIRL